MSTALRSGAEVACGRLATVHRGSLGGRAVAIKRARAEVPGAAAALRREARILTATSHPGIVPVLDVLDDPVTPALVLGWADGGSLGELLADGPLPVADLLHLLRPLALGLDALRAAGVAHLDVTAENVLLAAAGPVLIDPAPPGAGTPGYCDPVVAAGGPASSRSDVFGLAACAHLALTGRAPRASGGLAIGVHLPVAVAEALAAGLDPHPHRRPASAPVLVDRLEAALLAEARPAAAALALPASEPAVRPVARGRRRPPGPACTWPFDRWKEEAAAAVEREATLDAAIGTARRRRPHRRRRTVALVLVLVAVGALAAGLLLSPIGLHATGTRARTSAPDSTRRPPAARPPPTATPGGNP